MRKIAGYSVLVVALAIPSRHVVRSADKKQVGVPTFEVDPSWPKIESNWIFGSIGGITIDPANDHIWVTQRPGALDKDENYAAQTLPK